MRDTQQASDTKRTSGPNVINKYLNKKSFLFCSVKAEEAFGVYVQYTDTSRDKTPNFW